MQVAFYRIVCGLQINDTTGKKIGKQLRLGSTLFLGFISCTRAAPSASQTESNKEIKNNMKTVKK